MAEISLVSDTSAPDSMDTSQNGDHSPFRNALLDGALFNASLDAIPADGILVVDYATALRPPRTAVPMRERDFDALLFQLTPFKPPKGKLLPTHSHSSSSPCYPACPMFLLAKRAASDDVDDLNGHDMRELDETDLMEDICGDVRVAVWLKLFLEGKFLSIAQAISCVRAVKAEDKVTCAVALWGRVVIAASETVQSLGSAFIQAVGHDQVDDLAHRLGWLNLFDPKLCDGMYTLSLSIRDERRIVVDLIRLAVVEEGTCWKHTTLNGRPFDLPVSWIREVPHHGHLRLKFVTGNLADWMRQKMTTSREYTCRPHVDDNIGAGNDAQGGAEIEVPVSADMASRAVDRHSAIDFKLRKFDMRRASVTPLFEGDPRPRSSAI